MRQMGTGKHTEKVAQLNFYLSLFLNSWTILPYSIFIFISMFRKIVFWELRCDRIAHFIIDFCEQKTVLKEVNFQLNIHFLGQKKVCNRYWLERVRKEFTFFPLVRQLKFIDGVARNSRFLRPLTRRISWRPSSEYSSRYLESQKFKSNRTPILFSAEENAKGKSWLNSHGIDSRERIITMLLRDSKYLTEEFESDNFSYHDYRDVNTDQYGLAISSLVNLGYVVIRMGKNQAKRIPFEHPKFIDYAFCDSRTDFLDLWLIANSTGMVSTGTGQDQIAITNDIPILFSDLTPMVGISQYANCLVAPKKLHSSISGELIDLKAQLTTFYYTTSELNVLELEVRSLTPEELLQCCDEFHQFINNDWSGCVKYNELVYALGLFEPHKIIHNRCSVSKSWVDSFHFHDF